jgi:phosphoribosylamine--glycine ligase
MKVLLVGHGGREAALAWRIARSPQLTGLVVTGVNPGWPGVARVRLANGVDDIVALALEEAADLVVVGPEVPLQEGVADALAAVDVPCFGPIAAAARLETSKAFAKHIMAEAGVPTAGFVEVDRHDPDSVAAGRARLDRGDVVVKVDGLAAGKGVIVCHTAAEAHAALDEVWSGRFGAAADRVVLEDRLEGPEVSVFGISDGSRVVALPSTQDHKALLDGGAGPNTGGMGAYAPCPLMDDDQVEEILDRVHRPVIATMAARGTPFRGVLFVGIMLTADGPRVLEFNARFGDPECQTLMCLWDDDILPWLAGVARGRLPHGKPKFRPGAACCVVLASRGYPRSSEQGTFIPEGMTSADVVVFHAGTRRGDDGLLRTAGGRVLGITGIGENIATARARAYAALPGWNFDGAQFRTDIAGQAVADRSGG